MLELILIECVDFLRKRTEGTTSAAVLRDQAKNCVEEVGSVQDSYHTAMDVYEKGTSIVIIMRINQHCIALDIVLLPVGAWIGGSGVVKEFALDKAKSRVTLLEKENLLVRKERDHYKEKALEWKGKAIANGAVSKDRKVRTRDRPTTIQQLFSTPLYFQKHDACSAAIRDTGSEVPPLQAKDTNAGAGVTGFTQTESAKEPEEGSSSVKRWNSFR